jgi:diketogulonate reductase-like aldo/keto reductase
MTGCEHETVRGLHPLACYVCAVDSCGSLDETVRAYNVLEQALAQGKARAIGISNFNGSEVTFHVRGSLRVLAVWTS